MSIIYDALKKVEASAAKEEPKPATDKGAPRKTRPFLVYALMACFALFIINAFYGRLSLIVKRASQKPASAKKAAGTNLYAKLPVFQAKATDGNNKDTAQEGAPPQFVLNGVFFSGAEGYALINDRIVKRGDKIDGATVLQISLDEVDLELGSLIIKLSPGSSEGTK